MVDGVIPAVYNLSLYRGDSFEVQVTLWADSAGTIPLDLTGATVKAEIRNQPGGLSIVALGTTVLLPNKVMVAVLQPSWPTMPPAGVWDLQVTTSAGKVMSPIGGKVTVTPDVTDSTVVVVG